MAAAHVFDLLSRPCYGSMNDGSVYFDQVLADMVTPDEAIANFPHLDQAMTDLTNMLQAVRIQHVQALEAYA